MAEQRRLVESCQRDGHARLLLLEHPPTYTLGARGRQEHLLLDAGLLAALGASVHRTDRGGDITFHGPGQLVGYPIFDLRRWQQGPRWYVRSLEAAAEFSAGLSEYLSSFSWVHAFLPKANEPLFPGFIAIALAATALLTTARERERKWCWLAVGLLGVALSLGPSAGLFTFLYNDAVPATNNHAERSIRPAVLVRKTQGCNKSQGGAEAHAMISSVSVSEKQRGGSPVERLAQIARQRANPP